MRYSLQEMNISGFTYYEIIDTDNRCKVVFMSSNHCAAIEELKRLERLEEHKQVASKINGVLRDTVDDLFIALHDELNIAEGDASPELVCYLDDAIDKLKDTMLEIVAAQMAAERNV